MPRIESEQPSSDLVINAAKELEAKRAALLAKRAGATGGQSLALCENHIVACIDTSGSMQDYFENTTRLQAANRGLVAMVTASDPKKTAYSIVKIDSQAKLVIPRTTDYIKIQTRRFEGGGGTDGFGALTIAKQQQPTRIIVLTDGEWYSTSRCLELALRPPMVPIDTIAIGDAGDEFLRELSRITGGVFKRVTSVQDLRDHFVMLEPRNYLQLEHK